MDGLWTVEFSLVMRDAAESDTPSVDGEMLVRGYDDIIDVVETARKRLAEFGYDGVIIHGANRCGFKKKGVNSNGTNTIQADMQ